MRQTGPVRFFIPWFLMTMTGLTAWRFLFRFVPRGNIPYLFYIAGAIFWIYIAFSYVVVTVRRTVLQELEESKSNVGHASLN